MLKNSCSESIHVWQMPGAGKSKAVKSEETSPKEAYKAFKNGASLYFGSSPDFRDTYMKHLSLQMDQSFGGYHRASHSDITAMSQMGEIETFVSRKGNYTDWHTDFQENFTIQLQGTKTWRLLPSGL